MCKHMIILPYLATIRWRPRQDSKEVNTIIKQLTAFDPNYGLHMWWTLREKCDVDQAVILIPLTRTFQLVKSSQWHFLKLYISQSESTCLFTWAEMAYLIGRCIRPFMTAPARVTMSDTAVDVWMDCLEADWLEILGLLLKCILCAE